MDRIGKVDRAKRRAPARVFSPAEIADLAGVSLAIVERALITSRRSFFPHAVQIDGEWQIPLIDARKLVGQGLEPMMSIKTFAELMGFSYIHIYNEVAAGNIRHNVVLGQKRIPSSEYWRLRGLPQGQRSA